jgi:hypothetical protein
MPEGWLSFGDHMCERSDLRDGNFVFGGPLLQSASSYADIASDVCVGLGLELRESDQHDELPNHLQLREPGGCGNWPSGGGVRLSTMSLLLLRVFAVTSAQAKARARAIF